MKILFIFSTLVIFISCSLSDGRDYSNQDTMNVIYEYNKKISKQYAIEITMEGLDYAGKDKIYDGKIHVINLGYSTDKKIKYEEARLIFYDLIDGLLEHINRTGYLKKYFFRFPVKYEDLSIHLSFDCHDKNRLKKGDVSTIHIYDGEIYCYSIDIEEPEKTKQNEIIPDVFILQEKTLTESLIKEDPYTKEITGRRPCPMSSKSIMKIQTD